jgi:hypothetical protein
MAEKKAKSSLISSPLFGALNNIVPIKRSATSMRNTQKSFQGFLKFMDVEIKNMQAIKMPSKKKLREISNINVSSTFGRPGNLISSLASGALDAAGFLGDMFGRSKKQNPKSGKTVPTKGPKLKFGGLKALGIANTVFAGLDFATGLQEGESVGKSAAGAGGALAGSLLGGAIGQALIPIPGLGFIAGSMAGNFLGGYLGDRGYETFSGENNQQSVKEKAREKLRTQEKKQRLLASSTSLTLPQVLNKFESVVINFERYTVSGGITVMEEVEEMEQKSIEQAQKDADAIEENMSPSGPDIAMEGDGTFIQGSTGRSTGPHFHIGPTVNYGKPQGRADARDAALKVAKALLAKKVPFLLSNAKVWVKPSQKLSDNELADLIKREQSAHENRSMGSSFGGIDIAAPYGTRLPFPVEDVRDRGDGFGITGNLVGTKAFVAHGAVGSRSTPKEKIKKTAPTAQAEGVTPMISAPRQSDQQKEQLSKMSTDQLKGMMDPTKTASSNPLVFQAASKAREEGKTQGLTGEELERNVLIASIQASQSSPTIIPVPSMQQVIPRQIEQYPEYNQPQTSSITLMPMILSSGESSQKPMVISSGGGGGGNTIIMPPPPQGVLLNSLFKTMLLTNLSAT